MWTLLGFISFHFNFLENDPCVRNGLLHDLHSTQWLGVPHVFGLVITHRVINHGTVTASLRHTTLVVVTDGLFGVGLLVIL